MAVLFRLRASLHFTAPGLAAWAREQNAARVAMARPVNPGKPHSEPVVNRVTQQHYVADLPFSEGHRDLANDTWDTLLAIVQGRGNLAAPTHSQWSGMDLHVCNNEDPPRPCTLFLGEWTDRLPDTMPGWVQPTGAHDAYDLGAEVTHNERAWRSTSPDNVWEPGVFGWAVI